MTRLLDESKSRALMLVAPAGYGKTTLARQWLEDKAHVWYQGGPATADVAALAVNLADVCAPVMPGAGDRMRARLRVSNSPDQDAQLLAELLAEDLADWPPGTWLAIDDYHFAIGSPAAEAFVDVVFTETAVPLVVITRERPSWVTARRLLYGEVHELGQATLAMDQDEVTEVLSASGQSQAVGLMALAEGWPAVIGLAASSQRPMPDEIPEALYDFFAQELFDALPDDVEAGLQRLAIAPWVEMDAAEILLGDRAEATLARGEQAGVLNRDATGVLSMHPLLRAFLLRGLTQDRTDLPELARQLVDFYSTHGDWDAAFSVIEPTGDNELFCSALDRALPVLLGTGRLSTLVRWLAYAENHHVRALVVELASAEVAYRAGDGIRARGIAEHAAATTRPDDPLRGRFLLLAGKAALLLHDTEPAMAHMNAAQKERLTSDDAYEAAWGTFLAAARLESPDAPALLEQLGSMSQGLPDRELRAMNGRWVLGVRMGTIHGLADEFEAALHLVRLARDPTIRSAFLISRIHLLTLLARYDESLDAVGDLEDEARDFRLEFTIPHISMAHAHAQLGMRHFAQAAPLIAHAEEAGVKRRDVFVRMNSAALRARLLVYQGMADQAIAHLREHWQVLPERSLYAEYLSIRALALACSGDEAAAAEAEAIPQMSLGIEAMVLGLSARAVVAAVRHDDDADDRAREALAASLRTGNYDGLLFACRVSPPFADAIAAQADCKTHLAQVIRVAGDHLLARRLGIPLPPRTSTDRLTPRECEVYELLTLGRTNREIAAALFISEPTAKAHTLHVLEKLGLHSRTEVALHGAEARPFYAASSSDHGS